MKEQGYFIELQEAFDLLDGFFKPSEVISVDLDKATGHVLANDLISPEDHPPFSRSAMDGFAIKAHDVQYPGVSLTLTGESPAGKKFEGQLHSGQCVKIMTGAPVPEGADCVVMKEHTKTNGNKVIFEKPAQKNLNIRFKGEDIRKGQIAVKRGEVVTPAIVAVCALLGLKKIPVFRTPSVSIIITGDEITEYYQDKIPQGYIRNSNGPMLINLVRKSGIEPQYLGIVPDRKGELLRAIEKGLKSDLLLITGGISMGDYDHVTEILTKVGLRYLFRKVKTKPGRPLSFAYGEKGMVFGIPGNPVSALICFYLYIKPAIGKMMGFNVIRQLFTASARADIKRDKTRTLIAPSIVKFTDGKYTLHPVRYNGSGDIIGASRGNSLGIVPAGEGILKVGETVKFIFME